jgi:hypothetical protein
MSVLAILGVIGFFAFLVESLVEYLFGAIAEHVQTVKPYQWLIMYISAGVGLGGAFIYRFDLVYLLGSFLGADIQQSPFGVALTGLAIGRGANYIHDIVSKFFQKES